MTVRADLLSAEDAAWRQLCARFDKLSLQQWTRPGASGEWTPKDVIAHVACWHAETAGRLERLRSGSSPSWKVDVEAFNADAYERCRDLTLREAQAMSGAARHRFREEVASVDDDALGRRVTGWVTGSGHEHYLEHIPLLDAFLEGT